MMMRYVGGKHRIRYFVVGLFLVIMLPVTILCTVGMQRNSREIRERNQEYWELLAEDIAYDMDKAIQEYDKLSMTALIQTDLLNILYQKEFNGYEYLKAYTWLENRLFLDMYLRESLVSSIQVIGNNGFYYSSDYEITYPDVAPMTEEIDKTGKIKIFMSYSDGGKKDRDHVTVARYINSYKDLKPLGYFLVNLKTAELDRIWENKNITDIRVLVLDEAGEAVYGEMVGDWEKNSLAACLHNKKGSFYSPKGDFLYVYQASDYTGWTSLLAVPQDTYQEHIWSLGKMFLIAGVVSVLLASILAYFMVRQVYVDQMEHQKIELLRNRAELKALQTQINPHFLYNTLGAINMYSVCEDSNAVQDMTEALSKMFRYAVQNPLTPVKIAEELEHVRNYLKIQEYRLGKLPAIRIEAGEEFEKVRMLRLSLQPLVENVFKHAFAGGIEPYHYILIKVQKNNGDLWVDVMDNGRGPSMDVENMDFMTDGEKGGRGIGLSNVHRRLQLSYGEKYGLKISGKKGEGMCIRICQPYIRDEE